ncbi:hypothetical protein MNQ98_18335 [Paenibacillus sp. N3/727]|uniref:hypothetical protein n=1 Tax=Paenibacillus sp. N3/727 TaxID=2925845 RepID=UPI001F52E727|nr:hypothetical protein [Paenibacillus sp. N3/727]UNK16457.1 hypothetical protein MNQ98_18335 [Paenibacillus sp. N3/727]
MPIVRPLITDQDFQEAADLQYKIRIFKDNHLIDSGTIVIRFTNETIITQSGISSLGYHKREECEFFEIRK